jgi:hypothetical protein
MRSDGAPTVPGVLDSGGIVRGAPGAGLATNVKVEA